MNAVWAVSFPSNAFDEAIRLWSFPEIEVFQSEQVDQGVWFRGAQQTETLDLLLRGFLNGRRFRVAPDGQLTSPQHLVPHGHLPLGPWLPLRQWMQLELPQATFPGQLPQHLKWNLVHDSHESVEATAIVTTSALWCHFATRASLVRLRPLQFAADTSGRVVLWGGPLPPVAGQRLIVREGIAVPCGRTWMPPIAAKSLCRILGIASGDLALLHDDGTWEHLRQEQFVAATRESVRATFQGARS